MQQYTHWFQKLGCRHFFRGHFYLPITAILYQKCLEIMPYPKTQIPKS